MKDFHDLSAHKPSAPRPTRRSGPQKRTIVIVVVAVLVVAGGALAFSKRGDDGSAASSPAADPRFCTISAQLSGRLAAVGVPPAGPVPETVRPEAIGQVLRELSGQADQLRDVAPSAVRDDVAAFLGSLERAAAGDMAQVRSTRFVETEKAIVGYLQTDPCRTGGTPDPAAPGS